MSDSSLRLTCLATQIIKPQRCVKGDGKLQSRKVPNIIMVFLFVRKTAIKGYSGGQSSVSRLWPASPMCQKGGEQARLENLFIPSVDCQTPSPCGPAKSPGIFRLCWKAGTGSGPSSSSCMSGQKLHPILPETGAYCWIPYTWCTKHMMQR